MDQYEERYSRMEAERTALNERLHRVIEAEFGPVKFENNRFILKSEFEFGLGEWQLRGLLFKDEADAQAYRDYMLTC